MAGRFDFYFHGTRYDNTEGGIEDGPSVVVDTESHNSAVLDDPNRRARVLDAYEQEIRKLAETVNVVLVFPIPTAGWHVPDHAVKLLHFYGDGTDLTTSFAAYENRTREVNALFSRLEAELPNVFGVRVHEELCSEQTGRCVNVHADGVYYNDDDHLSRDGARRVSPAILKEIKAALSDVSPAQD